MKIAITEKDGQVFGHFGQSKSFAIFTIEDKNIKEKSMVPCDVQGHGSIPKFLNSLDVELVICGNLGDGMKKALKEANIELLAGASGDIDQAVNDYLNGQLKHNETTSCNDHDHHHHE